MQLHICFFIVLTLTYNSCCHLKHIPQTEGPTHVMKVFLLTIIWLLTADVCVLKNKLPCVVSLAKVTNPPTTRPQNCPQSALLLSFPLKPKHSDSDKTVFPFRFQWKPQRVVFAIAQIIKEGFRRLAPLCALGHTTGQSEDGRVGRQHSLASFFLSFNWRADVSPSQVRQMNVTVTHMW